MNYNKTLEKALNIYRKTRREIEKSYKKALLEVKRANGTARL